MPKRVSVIGAGTIGASWAACFLARGFEVSAYDPSPNGEAFARRFIDNAWPTLEKLGTVQPGADRARIAFFGNPTDAAKDADFVQESGPEREDIKIDLFAAIDAGAPPETVIATSSSGLLVSRVSTKCKHPDRCVIGHPFNPPHLIPLVEVVGGPKTSAEAIVKAMDFYLTAGKKPIHIKKEGRGMSPTGCRRRCGARLFTSSPKAWCRFRMRMPRLPMAPACAGR
jgi:3-hydroxyacyl-CoA dehydrogenase